MPMSLSSRGPSLRSEFAALLDDPAYRQWFAAWWAADYSIEGCEKKKLDWKLGRPHAARFEFAGREWGPGRLPPHDLDGNFNETFFSTGWYSWDAFFQRQVHMANSDIDVEGCWFDKFEFVNQASSPILKARCCFVLGDLTVDSARNANLGFKASFIRGGLKLTNLTLGGRAVFTKIIVRGDVALRALKGHSVHLNRTTLGGSVVASEGVTELDLTEATIDGDLTADTSVIKVDGYASTIGGTVNINGASQSRTELVSFRNAEIGGGLAVANCNIAVVNLERTGIGHHLSLQNGQINSLLASQVHVRGDFVATNFTVLELHLGGARLGGQLQWSQFTVVTFEATKATFKGAVSVVDCTFNQLNAYGSTFGAATSFARSRFTGPAAFNAVTFEGETNFKGAAFHDRATFIKANFRQSATFAADKKDSLGAIPGGDGFGYVSFRASAFTASPGHIWCVDFDGRQFNGTSDFDGSTFAGAPRFFEVAFHEDASFRYTEFLPAPHPTVLERCSTFRRHAKASTALRAALNSWNKERQHYEHAYRSLKMRMAEIGAARDERRFLALELRARRARFDQEVKLLESGISLLYDLTSRYGESIWRPLACTVVVTSLAATIYHGLAPAHIDWATAVEFAVRQVFKPFNVWADGGSDILAAPKPTPMDVLFGREPTGMELPLGLKFLASAQSLACLTLLFLSALAIRKRFRLT